MLQPRRPTCPQMARPVRNSSARIPPLICFLEVAVSCLARFILFFFPAADACVCQPAGQGLTNRVLSHLSGHSAATLNPLVIFLLGI